jgi:hypothetical protein
MGGIVEYVDDGIFRRAGRRQADSHGARMLNDLSTALGQPRANLFRLLFLEKPGQRSAASPDARTARPDCVSTLRPCCVPLS